MKPPHNSRRSFLRKSGAAAGAAMLGISLPQFLTACREAQQAKIAGSFQTLSSIEAACLDAVAACIVPTTDTPGAREAGAVYFIDTVVGVPGSGWLDSLRPGIDDLNARAREASSSTDTFAELNEAAQVGILKEIEDTEFFYDVRLLTLAGMLADPSYGGNRDRIGWDLIGFEGHFASTPPFGYYDEHYSADSNPNGNG